MRIGIMVGILAYAGCSAETLEDYCRFMYHLGRRNTEWDFFLGVRSKIEQFRGRNSMVESAIRCGAKYLLMLDDDHVIDWQGSAAPNEQYDFLRRFVYLMEKDPKTGVIGALYYQRDSYHNPVVMNLGVDQKYYWLKDEELTGGLQEVDVTGGGCMLLNMEIFNWIPSPWFEPELEFSTDIQIARKIKAAGFKVFCDTGTEIGHVKTQRTIVTSQNKQRVTDVVARVSDRITDDWAFTSMMTIYNMDIEEYTGRTHEELTALAEAYKKSDARIMTHKDPVEYYKQLGIEQVARQWFYHNHVLYGTKTLFMETLHEVSGKTQRFLDFGCGTSPIGFEMARLGHEVTFIDPGPALEFVKWRAKKRNVETAKWDIDGEYDVVLLFDVIEHIKDWKAILDKIFLHLKKNGTIVTNYFTLGDRLNPEHISMDKDAVKRWFVEHSIYPVDILIWRRHGALERRDVDQTPGDPANTRVTDA